jgi:hypothetical protein
MRRNKLLILLPWNLSPLEILNMTPDPVRLLLEIAKVADGPVLFQEAA